MDAARGGRTLITGMKKLAVVLVVLVGGSIPYLVAQQPIEVPCSSHPLRSRWLRLTIHRFPKRLPQYVRTAATQEQRRRIRTRASRVV